MAYYRKPDWFTKNFFNRAVELMTRVGVSVWGSRILRVRGRKSGEWHSHPVNLLTYEGKQYLVAPRGLTQWVRNIGATGGAAASWCSGPGSSPSRRSRSQMRRRFRFCAPT